VTTDNFCFYLQNRLIQTNQTGGQWYSDTSPISIPWCVYATAFIRENNNFVQELEYKCLYYYQNDNFH
jgi:hypothetical protein